jgi:hypothetical protein
LKRGIKGLDVRYISNKYGHQSILEKQRRCERWRRGEKRREEEKTKRRIGYEL